MKIEVMTITPDMAKKCLEKNKVENRNLSMGRINSMISDITSGNWVLTHQGIAFDDDGNLLDGQHRLAACVKCGIPIKTVVTKGLTKEACIAVDNTRPRSITDHAKQIGMDITSSHSAIAVCLEYGPAMQEHLSIQHKLDLIEKYIDAIGFSIKICRSAKGFQSVSKAVIARAWYTHDRDKLKRFMDVYISGIPDSKEESAALALSRYLRSEANLYGWEMRKIMYQKTESALFNFLRGQKMQKIYGTDKEMFPIPENKPII